MKKTIFILAILFASNFSFAQMSEKFIAAMEAKIPAVDTIRNPDGMTELANSFERIAGAEKTQWLAYYYAALCNVNAGLMMNMGDVMQGNAAKTDPIADKAETLLNKAEEMMKENAEIFIVKKMIATLRMMGDPMSRYMTYGPMAAEALETAQKLDAGNPRIYLLEAQDKYFTPEQFGGSKDEAKTLFEKALSLYDTFKPETSISPNWGKGQVQYFLSQYK